MLWWPRHSARLPCRPDPYGRVAATASVKRLQYFLLRRLTGLDWLLRERLTAAGRLAAGAAFAAAIAGVDTRQTLTYQLFALLAAALLVSALLALGLGPGRGVRLQAQRLLPRHATAGETLSYRIEVHNSGTRAVAGLQLRERFADARPGFAEFRNAPASVDPRAATRNWVDRKGGYFRWRRLIERRLPRQARGGEVALLPPGARAQVQACLVPRRRGVLALAGIDCTRVDPLGLVRGRARLEQADKLVVLPRRYRLPRLHLPARRVLQTGGHARTASVGDSEEFLALREYRPGDSLRRIHWRSFARTGQPVVKEFEAEFFERHALVLDTTPAAGMAGESAFEEAVSVAASFVATIDTQECLLDLVFVAGEPECHTAGRGEASNAHLLEVLAGVQASDDAGFPRLCAELLAMRGALSSAILVLLAWDAPRRTLAAQLRASGLAVRVLLVCADQEAPPAQEGLVVLHPGRIEAGLAGLA
jgi:uncharacterized protein (DUF58 family)